MMKKLLLVLVSSVVTYQLLRISGDAMTKTFNPLHCRPYKTVASMRGRAVQACD